MKPELLPTFADFAASDPLDLGLGALLVAREAYPNLDPDLYLERLEQMASTVEPRLLRLESAHEQLACLGEFLFSELGFSGNTGDYYDPRNSYLNDVMDRRLGIPITLSILYIEVGRRCALPLRGVNFPTHFIVLCDSPEGPLYADPFGGGKLLAPGDLEELLPHHRGNRLDLDNAFLQPVSSRDILARMLRNLKMIHAQKQRFSAAIDAGEKINMLQPEAAGDHRDLGNLYFRVGAYQQALASFHAYLRHAGEADDDREVRQRIATIGARLGALN